MFYKTDCQPVQNGIVLDRRSALQLIGLTYFCALQLSEKFV